MGSYSFAEMQLAYSIIPANSASDKFKSLFVNLDLVT